MLAKGKHIMDFKTVIATRTSKRTDVRTSTSTDASNKAMTDARTAAMTNT